MLQPSLSLRQSVASPTGIELALIAAAVAFGLAWLLVPVVRALAVRFNVVDAPEARRVHVAVTPRLGGIAVMLATIIATVGCLLANLSALTEILPHIALACALLLVGAVDDIRGLRAATKLGGTVLAAGMAAALGLRIDVIALPWGSVIHTGVLAVPITVCWIVAVCHAINLIDGLDGLAGSVTFVAAVAAAFTRIETLHSTSALLALALAGAILGFLRWNWTPAKIFLGDAGSLGIGGLVAVLALVPSDAEGRVVRAIDVTSLLLIAYPIADTTLAVLRRWLRGVPISVADRGHIHHRLLDAGLAQPRPTLWLAAWSAAAAGVGIAIRHMQDRDWRLGGTALSATLLLAALVMLRRLGVREIEAFARAAESLRRTWRTVVQERILTTDAAEQLQFAETLDAVDVALADCARGVGLLGAEMTRSSARRRISETSSVAGTVAVWSLDWPLSSLPGAPDDPIVLRLYGAADGLVRPHTAARFAETLLPAITSWLTLPRQRELLERRPAARRARRGTDGANDAAATSGESQLTGA